MTKKVTIILRNDPAFIRPTEVINLEIEESEFAHFPHLGKGDTLLAEYIFDNTNNPYNFDGQKRLWEGRSLSTGDMVIYDNYTWVCESFGWKNINTYEIREASSELSYERSKMEKEVARLDQAKKEALAVAEEVENGYMKVEQAHEAMQRQKFRIEGFDRAMQMAQIDRRY